MLLGLPLAAAGAQEAPPQSPPPQQPQPTTMTPATPTTNQVQVPGFGDLDKAHRGYLDRSDIPKDVESLRDLRMHFNDADLNHDGLLTPDEYGAYTGPKAPGQAH
ncbi:hypothetical protein ASG87_06860 [Frateuria sp. Soil773]|uniref:EF-hand domain-containing protein n=1 Tax=Frateuria sp. Soil773 TaxID=1736407 RepID=UPI0006FEEBB6|nr:EF-hand domain-containing protein [Frateuria sp. Soil773]KRE88332.1 hypothetical protein ASG87_06860 [Frateuria sp. Soil773]